MHQIGYNGIPLTNRGVKVENVGLELLSVPVITAIVEGIKVSFGFSGRFSFIVSIVVGILVAIGAGQAFGTDPTVLKDAFTGLLLGLSASGFYSGAVKPVKEEAS